MTTRAEAAARAEVVLRLHAQGLTTVQIAARLGVPSYIPARIVAANHTAPARRTSAETSALAHRLLAQGLAAAAIAKQLGVSLAHVHKLLRTPPSLES